MVYFILLPTHDITELPYISQSHFGWLNADMLCQHLTTTTKKRKKEKEMQPKNKSGKVQKTIVKNTLYLCK